MNCYGHDKRVEIVDKYNLICTAHIQLLNGQTVKSDAEREIKDKYYIFKCVNKSDAADIQEIVCGNGAARDLLQLARITAPPVFNMLHQNGGGGIGGGGAGTADPIITWNPAAEQLHNAIMILITAWNFHSGKMFDYLEEAEKYSNFAPFSRRVDRINQIIHRHNTSLRDILNDLAVNNNIRNYSFDLLEDILINDGITSYFEDANGRL